MLFPAPLLMSAAIGRKIYGHIIKATLSVPVHEAHGGGAGGTSLRPPGFAVLVSSHKVGTQTTRQVTLEWPVPGSGGRDSRGSISHSSHRQQHSSAASTIHHCQTLDFCMWLRLGDGSYLEPGRWLQMTLN